MSKTLIGVLVFIGICVLLTTCGYNNMVKLEETVDGQWANVESSYQRRADLIPNLVKTVKGSADFEKEVLTGVIEARSKATSINIDPSNLTPETIQKFEAAQNELSGALSRLLVTVERYPDLKASRNFLELQAQLEGTENRIAVERKRFNDSVRDYNSSIRKLPNVFYSKIIGFEKKGFFEAAKGADKVPDVEF